MSLAGRGGPTLPHHRVRLSAGVKEDLRMWCKFLEDLNCIDIASVKAKEDWDFQIYLNTAGGRGFWFILAEALVRRGMAPRMEARGYEHHFSGVLSAASSFSFVGCLLCREESDF